MAKLRQCCSILLLIATSIIPNQGFTQAAKQCQSDEQKEVPSLVILLSASRSIPVIKITPGAILLTGKDQAKQLNAKALLSARVISVIVNCSPLFR